ncbi:MAG TPA: hypothetical protein VJ810_04980 [Blastocatellia bacterium]|nr:hypothetical protein [Blastocatellia bacterium]
MTSTGNFEIRSFIIGVFLVCLSIPTFAQSNEGTPETTAKTYWATMQAADWARCANLVHSKSLSKIRNRANRFVDLLFGIDRFGGNLNIYFGVSTKEDFEKLSDAVVFEGLMRRIYLQPGFTEILKATTFQVVGTMEEKSELAHIVYRADVKFLDSEGKRLTAAKFESGNDLFGITTEVKLPEPDGDRVEVISVMKDGAAWKILLGEELDEMFSDWEKQITDFQENMRKMADALSAGKNKSRQKPKPKPAVRRR